MELGKVKDRLDSILDKMEGMDPTTEEYGVLLKRADDIRKIIQDEEKRRESDAIESQKNSIELSERRKDRWVKIGLGVGAGAIGIASIFADETRVACKSGLETIDKMKKMVR